MFVKVVLALIVLLSGVQGASSPLCHDCELVVGSLANFLVNPYFQHAIEAFVEEEICVKLPHGQIEDNCDQFVKGFVPTIIGYILDRISPILVCNEVQLCHNETFTNYQHVQYVQCQQNLAQGIMKYSDKPNCEYCETAVLAVKDYITISSNKLTTFLNYACDFMPYSEKCHMVVEDYFSAIIAQIENKFLNPTQVCETLKFCPVPSPEMLVM